MAAASLGRTIAAAGVATPATAKQNMTKASANFLRTDMGVPIFWHIYDKFYPAKAPMLNMRAAYGGRGELNAVHKSNQDDPCLRPGR